MPSSLKDITLDLDLKGQFTVECSHQNGGPAKICEGCGQIFLETLKRAMEGVAQ